MTGSYDLGLVALSYIIAALAAYTALDMAARITVSRGMAAGAWLLGGALAMGTGIWSMHFLGMLAFKLPIPVGYDLWITLFSLGAAVVVSALALAIVTRARLSAVTLILGAALMGAGICVMHYSGMAAMRMAPGISYDPLWFSLSVVIAVSASAVALLIAFHLRGGHSRRMYAARVGAAFIMGVAVVGMHYTGMAAANFAPDAVCLAAGSLTDTWTATPVAAVAVALLAVSLSLSFIDARLMERAARERAAWEAHRAREAEVARTEFLAWHDAQTGLPNKAALKNRFVQILAASTVDSTPAPFTVMYIEVANFNQLMRSHGEDNIKRYLTKVAQRIAPSLHSPESFGQWSEGAFLALVPGHPSDRAYTTRYHGLVTAWIVPGLETVRPELTIGQSVFPDDGTASSALVRKAIGDPRLISFDPRHFDDGSLSPDAALA